jgi:hypothetical protein
MGHNPDNSDSSEPPESSVQFMLAEFNRITQGEIYNRTSGESRVNLYITLLSFTGGGIVALRQFAANSPTFTVETFYAVAFSAIFLNL